MGTKVQSKSYLPGYHSMRDLNEDSNSFNWPLYCGDKTSSNGQYYNGFLPRVVDSCQGYDKDVVKRTMLEHEAIFKNQVYELHRVYRIQRNLMDEIKRKDLHQNRIPFETSLSSSPLASQVTSEGARKWNINIPSFPLSNSNSARPSVSGAEDTHSPYSHLKGSPAQGGSFPCQNGSSSKSKDVEVLESRPTKVRRKMFDLHLPADEYIDTEEGEQFKNDKASKINGNHNVAPEGSVKLFLGDASRSDSSLRSTNGLADLNEPVMVEESNPPEYVDLVSSSCDREIRGPELSAKDNSQFLGTPKEISMNSHIGRNNLYMENGNGRMWFPHVQEIGQSKNSLNSASQGFHPGKFQPVQALLNKAHERPNFQTDQSKIDLSRERTNNGLDSFMGSHRTSLYPVAPSPDFTKSWSQSWEKPVSSLSQRSIPVQPQPSQNFSSSTLSKSSHSPYQSHGVWGDLRHLTSNSRANSGLGKEFSDQNGFYHGSSSGSKELQVPLSSVSHDYPNCNNGNGVSEHFAAHGSSKYFNSSNGTKSLKGVDLNVVLAANGAVSQHGVGFVEGERNHKDDFVGLPWLRYNKNESANTSRDLNNCELSFFRSATDQLSGKSNTGKSPNQLFPQNLQSLPSSNDATGTSVEIADRLNKKMIIGFPNFEKPCFSEKECSETVETNKKGRLLDMNMPCDDAVEENPGTEKRTGEEVSVFRCLIDLNSCLSEDESPSIPFGPSRKEKTMTQIDLEVCAVPDSDGDVILEEENPKETAQLKTEQDEVVKMAAEAILDISSFVHKSIIYDSKDSLSGASMADPLNWFVEIACGTDIESKDFDSNEDASSEVEEVDYFESMTLKLTEAKAEEYMPEPLVLDNLQGEETGGSLLTTRPRRGQARRGRPRRDFQRDILPGLTSLSRHEVTEDLQTFGGMMRATGHSWQSGMARRNSGRNGGGRGRRRTVVSPPPVVVTIEVGVEERSLTGWGKTTRRPRRQRYPAGNPQSLPLS